jgi:hypothetical protein
MEEANMEEKLRDALKAGERADPGGPLSAYAREFYLKEFEMLRREIEIIINDYRATERNVLIAVGVSWAWLYGFRHEMPPLAWLAPCLFVGLGIMRHRGNEAFFRSINKYLKRLEKSFSAPGHPGGWEHAQAAKEGRFWTKISAWSFWLVILAATVVVAFFEIHRR